MKRIANDVALQTILTIMPPKNNVIVGDKENPMMNVGHQVFEGTVGDLSVKGNDRILRAKVYNMDSHDGVTYFTICTKREQY